MSLRRAVSQDVLEKTHILSGDHFTVNEMTYESNMWTNRYMCSSRFHLLPVEILEKILEYLNPVGLVAMRLLNIERITEIRVTKKHADFSECNAARIDYVSAFFTEYISLHIQEINFNNLFFVNSQTLEKCIVKCKNLRILSVFRCGLSYTNIISILESCEELEELHWDFFGTLRETELTPLIREEKKSLKKLYLNVKDIDIRSVIIIDILKRCGASPIEVCWNENDYFICSVYSLEDGDWLMRIFRLSVPRPPVFQKDILVISITKISLPGIFEIAPLQKLEEPGPLFTFDRARCIDDAFIEYRTCQYRKLPSNSVKTMDIRWRSEILYLKEDLKEMEASVEEIKKISGHKLLHLRMQNWTTPPINHRDEQEEKLCYRIQHNLLTELTSTCINIQKLNIAGLHIDGEFSFNSLCQLTNLKVLGLSSCTLKTAFTESRDYCVKTANLEVQQFKNFVLQCKNVERFSFFGCPLCHLGPSDEDIMAIALWPKLTHLVIENVRSLHSCQFLAQVAVSCSNFQSLELIEVGLGDDCCFLPNVVQVLHKSKLLFFLRINQTAFNCDSPSFWSSLALSQSLQGLCLSSDFDSVMKKELILDALIKLPYIHLLHLHLRRIPSDLEHQVNEMMRKNGVEVCWTDFSLHKPTSRIRCLDTHFL